MATSVSLGYLQQVRTGKLKSFLGNHVTNHVNTNHHINHGGNHLNTVNHHPPLGVHAEPGEGSFKA